MLTARLHTVQWLSPHGLHKLAYREWGDPDNPRVLLCVHGLTRSSADFETMAQDLGKDLRVVAADMPGRGGSDWLTDSALYGVPTYVSACVALVARLNAGTLDWFGTSMGGLIGMALASLPGNPIRKLVLNDIGPTLDPAALLRIGDYIGQDLRFPTFEAAAGFVREVSLSFGEHSDEQWRKLAADVLREDGNGQWVRHYDMGLAEPFRSSTPETAKADEAALWAAYDAIRCPTLLVRGANSDLLSPETARMMASRGPKATLVEIPDVGHAPTFIHDDQIAIARKFLIG